MKKVLILCNSSSGLYEFRKELLKRFVSEGIDFAVSVPFGLYMDELKAIGGTFIDTQIGRRSTNPFADLKLMKYYEKLLDEQKPDAVLTYTVKPSIYGGMACAKKKIPYLCTITGLGEYLQNPGKLQKILLFLYKIGLKKVSCMFFQNDTNRQFFEEHHVIGKNTRVVRVSGSGVNLSEKTYEPYPASDKPVRFMYLARLLASKGIGEYLDAAEYFHRERPGETEFDIFGYHDSEIFKERVEKLEKEGVIRFKGYTEHPHEMLSEHHALINPSYNEGMSNINQEAAACGRPLITGNIPGCQETFDDGVTGYGITPKDSQSLIEAIEKFLSLSHEEKEAMGRAGRKKMEEQFDRTKVIDTYINEILRVI